MATRVWYVTANRAAVNWGAAVSGGFATTRIYKLTDTAGTGNDQMSLWAATGQAVSAAQVSAAQAETSGDAIPAAHTPQKGGLRLALAAELAAAPVNTVASTGAAATLPDTTSARVHHLTVDTNTTLTFPTAAPGKRFLLALKQDAVGSRLVTWDANVRWPGGVAPTLTATAGRTDVFEFTCVAGTTWLGRTVGLNYSN